MSCVILLSPDKFHFWGILMKALGLVFNRFSDWGPVSFIMPFTWSTSHLCGGKGFHILAFEALLGLFQQFFLWDPLYPFSFLRILFVFLLKVKTKKMKTFAWKVLNFRVNTQDQIQRLLLPQWCLIYRKHEEDLDHLIWDCDFATSLWNRFVWTFGFVLARNIGCCSMFEEVFLNSPFCVKGKIL